ncbi:hypothetical protein NLJ89_g5263 [Agrocybe chaxingu]|uniref:Uncharacterized protein n=1 Tax=Agrocybe chaxingu TaxID=84603 RepID=A0A9W8MTR9_9AGAR|nr:hypothetical protein NLJ89_g5263 [Agrocybe chaxingu]
MAHTTPGPSRVHSGAHRTAREPEFVIESGWIKDVFGRDQYVGHGKIEEVEDDNDDGVAASVNLSDDQEDNFETPRGKSTAVPSSLHAGDYDLNGFREDDIPLNSTPPPGPRLKKLPSLRATTTSEYHSWKATSTTAPTMAAPGPASVSGVGLDEPTEVEMVRENLELLNSSKEHVKFMGTFFLSKLADHQLNQHIDLCSKMEESLASLHETLTQRIRIGAEEWNVRSPSWHQKYCKRLVSLRTTLQRLSRMAQVIESHSLRPRQSSAILTKLEQHEAKLADLASKYSIAFDRLRLRHLHFLLTQSHNEARRQKSDQKSRLMSRASFERRWKEGKTLRQTLRINFQDLRQEFYNNQRSRRPTAP